ncbi:venom dipeptidyl peptidase 4-like [Adelges cooleyi]|uniref:venom dipeptidyl peptidase 4-like n=1 Tax=Adelges cooleyi TaxID=133065 RepID=UPI00217FFD1F|nr:venom dipeptidyl peptidase 4-like [Adelges cooleyi]XP_050439501.1 venom dipeptidyl peptidase 4-like [Adelges cooleyi]
MSGEKDELDFLIKSSVHNRMPPSTDGLFWKKRNAILYLLFTVCLMISTIGIIVYMTMDTFHHVQYSNIMTHNDLNIDTLVHYKRCSTVKFNATWISDEDILTEDETGNIISVNVKTNTKSILAYNTMQSVRDNYRFDLSADKKYLLVAYNRTKTYKHSFLAFYDVINVKTGRQVTLRDSNHRPRQLMLAKWSPTKASLVIVDNYNIYYISSAAKPNHVYKVTYHGSEDYYTGVPDWVYEEEVFSSNSALWMSTSGSRLAYATFNDTLVKKMHIPMYGVPDTLFDQYSTIISYHYPKVGTPNPVVELFVSPLDVINDLPPKQIQPPSNFTNEVILKNVFWSDDSTLFALWMNRIQNEARLVRYVINDTVEIEHITEFREPNGWLRLEESTLIGPEHQVAVINPTTQADGDNYHHVCVIDQDGKMWPLTSGQFAVVELIKWDAASNYIYYLATLENKPEEQYMYRVKVKPNSIPKCLTCHTACTYNLAAISKDSTYYAHTCAGPDIPEVNIKKINGEHAMKWDENNELKRKLRDTTLPQVIFKTVPLTDGFEARVRLRLPPALQMSPDKTYPLLVHVYGGPDSNLALSKFVFDSNTYYSVHHDFIIAEIDGRGSGRTGDRILFANYKHFGTGEIQDQIIVAKYLQNNLPYIDKSRTAIWGWSYGGYVAGMTLAKDEENIFKCGLSVAPVTDWMYYDTIYTERFMGLFEDNFEGYRNSSLIYNAKNMKGKDYMLIHGTLDDNVHFQNTAMLSSELQHNGILFQQHVYIDNVHALTKVQNHLYMTISQFLTKCFRKHK